MVNAASPFAGDDFAREVRAGLGGSGQKTLPCRYLYDDTGSALFEAITTLPEYGLTRADSRILRAYAAEIAGMLPGPVEVAELGSGTGTKTRWILEAMPGGRRTGYYPIDISLAALQKCRRDLSAFADVRIVKKPYLEGLGEAAAARRRGHRLLVLFLGSTIGNFEPAEAERFLGSVRESLKPGDALLLGTDLVKPAELLLRAYDDQAGMTARFNLNLLTRINRELGANFRLANFAHQARYDGVNRRVEMHLRSLVEQNVQIPGAGGWFHFEKGETIWTESSHKFELQEVRQLAARSGWLCVKQWVDQDWPFAETLLAVEGGG